MSCRVVLDALGAKYCTRFYRDGCVGWWRVRPNRNEGIFLRFFPRTVGVPLRMDFSLLGFLVFRCLVDAFLVFAMQRAVADGSDARFLRRRVACFRYRRQRVAWRAARRVSLQCRTCHVYTCTCTERGAAAWLALAPVASARSTVQYETVYVSIKAQRALSYGTPFV